MLSADGDVVFVLDIVGYDARGGNAEVFSTLERAQAAVDAEWKQTAANKWEQVMWPGSVEDKFVIYRRTVVPAEASQ